MIEPTSIDESRNEMLTLGDDSELELTQQMRNDCRTLYLTICDQAKSRRYVDNGVHRV